MDVITFDPTAEEWREGRKLVKDRGQHQFSLLCPLGEVPAAQSAAR